MVRIDSLTLRATAVALVCLLTGNIGAAAQNKPAAGPDEGELLAYRLSIQTLQKIEGTMKTVMAAAKSDPALKQQLSSDAVAIKLDTQKTLSEVERELAEVSVLVKALQANGLTPREYVKFVIVLGRSQLASDFQKAQDEYLNAGGDKTLAAMRQAAAKDPTRRAGPQMPSALGVVAPENIKFVRDHRAGIERFAETMDASSGG